jgi:glucosyl-dolichyl phosphate glucuronosyltransferase
MIALVFSTRNGISTLPAMLERLAALRIPSGGLRILAVDNGSHDGSGALLRQWRDRLPLEVIEYPIAGKNLALNRALDHLRRSRSEPELVVFTDDDVLPREDWLVQLARSAAEHPDIDLFGGRIVPQWPATTPDWLNQVRDYFGVLFAATETDEGPCAGGEIFGPNMAIRGGVLAAGARFDPRIGPNGLAGYAMGSETEFLQRLERTGHRCAFVADAVVGHQVKPAHLTVESVLSRAFRHGLGKGLLDGRDPSRGRSLARVAAALLASEAKALAARLPWWRSRRLHVLYGRQWQRGYCTAWIESKSFGLLRERRGFRTDRNILGAPNR